MTKTKKLLIGLIAIIALITLIVVGVLVGSKIFLSQEDNVRSAWAVDVGEMIGSDEQNQIEIRNASVDSSLAVMQLVPFSIEEEGFTYYNVAVQEQIAAALEKLKLNPPSTDGWRAQTPLAVLSPYGTGSNDLYLYFKTDAPTEVTYTISVDNEAIADYTATAKSSSSKKYSEEHEFLMIGLVPGETNHVTMHMTGAWGNVRQVITFDITMPDTLSGYPTILEYTDGTSTADLSDGLFVMMRTNGYLGYGFFFDNNGVLRYEMILEGFGMDRILHDDDGSIITCVSTTKLAKINPLGRVEQVYSLEDDYELHHDICFSGDDSIMALVSINENPTIEDGLIEINLTTGEITETINFFEFMADYAQVYSRPTALTDDFFYMAGDWDWLHLNTLDCIPEEDSIIVSSRETSTIIKVCDVHTSPYIDWMIGNPDFWEGTPYEGKHLTQVGDFAYQYGQHSVEYAGPGAEDGVYYIRTYNNNYWSLNSRDFEMEVEDGVCTEFYGSENDYSWVYVYEVNENDRSVTLHDSFPVPYSSIVSNAAPTGKNGNWVVNSGMANVWGEYDSNGTLIREYAYDCTMQGYRTFKFDTTLFWHQTP